MAGVAWACAFLKRADGLNNSGTEHAMAMFREGKPQAPLLQELLATMAAHPELITGANAMLTEYLTSMGSNGAGKLNLDVYAGTTYADFTRTDDPDEPEPQAGAASQSVVREQTEALHDVRALLAAIEALADRLPQDNDLQDQIKRLTTKADEAMHGVVMAFDPFV